jgi:alkyl hydroperoxide reductase subunit AhpF
MDHKFRFQDHINYAAEKCTKLIHNLSKMAKLSWGIKHAAIETIYKGAILPLLTYGAPVWIDAMKYEHNRRKYIRVQRLINIRMAKAYRTTSSEALCILTGNTPIIIKLEEAVKRYNIKKKDG